MHEDLDQKISQFLDNELDQDQALALLQKIGAQPELKQKLDRYEAISHALKADKFLSADPDFLTRVSQQIQHEPFYLLPRSHLETGRKSFKNSNKLLAVAASIVLAVIFVARDANNSANKPITQSSAQLVQQQVSEQSPKPVVFHPLNEQYPLNARINDYLQAHSSSVYTNGDANFRPFAKVSAHNQQ